MRHFPDSWWICMQEDLQVRCLYIPMFRAIKPLHLGVPKVENNGKFCGWRPAFPGCLSKNPVRSGWAKSNTISPKRDSMRRLSPRKEPKRLGPLRTLGGLTKRIQLVDHPAWWDPKHGSAQVSVPRGQSSFCRTSVHFRLGWEGNYRSVLFLSHTHMVWM